MNQRSGLFLPAALAALFVVPSVAWQDRPANLQEALQRTLLTLESLAGLGERIGAGEREAVTQLLVATEPALAAGDQPGLLLTELRGEVAALEIELDTLHALTATGEPGAATNVLDPGRVVPATTGLDDRTRALLGSLTPQVGAQAEPVGPGRPGAEPGTTTSRAPDARRSFEEPGYTADPLRLARAYYRTGRWEEALALLDGRGDTPEEVYWRARCLDKLGRFDEATSAYQSVVDDPRAGEQAQRAREDLEFLRWRRSFEQRRKAAGPAGKDGQPR